MLKKHFLLPSMLKTVVLLNILVETMINLLNICWIQMLRKKTTDSKLLNNIHSTTYIKKTQLLNY